MKIIVFVCLGNAYRSPYAETRFRELLQERGLKEVKVSSAGILLIEGGSQEHRRRVRDADLVLVMEEAYKEIVRDVAKKPLVYTLREYALDMKSNLDIRDPILGNFKYKNQIDECMKHLLLKIIN